jgi:hypothetical protein
MNSGIITTFKGAMQTLQGALQMSAAKQAKNIADQLGNTTGSNMQLTTPTLNTNTTSSPASMAINPGTQTDPAVANQDGSLSTSGDPNITPPINPDSPAGGGGSGPAAGTFAAGNPDQASGGGGAGGLGVGGLSPAKAEAEQSAPRAFKSRSNTGYSQGNSGYAASNGSNSAAGGGDLSFLANLLPKPNEEMAKNGILDYGGRSPASLAPYSFLGQNVNIFERVSQAYNQQVQRW